MGVENEKCYDVCIVGAGPGGLASLSAILEPYTINLLSKDQANRASNYAKPAQPSVCVVDPEPWMAAWRARFAALEIGWLRSPAMAHPDAFDAWSLTEFAHCRGRGSELLSTDEECLKSIRCLMQAQGGLFKLPSTQLFNDFCDDLVKKLPHDFIRAKACTVSGEDGAYEVELADGSAVRARAVVLALGVPGPRIVPQALAQVPPELAFHTDDLKRLSELRKNWRVLVVGGGLTAVQAAQLATRKGCKVTLCSRRQLHTRSFDIDLRWFDPRMQYRFRHDFLSQPHEERLVHLRTEKGGGSVPRRYMDQLKSSEQLGEVQVVSAEAEVVEMDDTGVVVSIGGRKQRFDRIILACGHRPDCLALPLLRDLHEKYPLEVVGGLPVLSQDLQWGQRQIFVVGALAGLAVGPDAANLMGCHRAAQVVANGLGIRDWLKEETKPEANRPFPAAGNRFSALGDSDTSDDE